MFDYKHLKASFIKPSLFNNTFFSLTVHELYFSFSKISLLKSLFLFKEINFSQENDRQFLNKSASVPENIGGFINKKASVLENIGGFINKKASVLGNIVRFINKKTSVLENIGRYINKKASVLENIGRFIEKSMLVFLFNIKTNFKTTHI